MEHPQLSHEEKSTWFVLISMWCFSYGIVYGVFATLYPPRGFRIAMSVVGGTAGLLAGIAVLLYAYTRRVYIALIPVIMFIIGGTPVLIAQYANPPEEVVARQQPQVQKTDDLAKRMHL